MIKRIQKTFHFLPFKRNKQGFTLIEILVTTTILILLASGSIAGYIRFNERQQLKSAGLTLKNALREVQSKAFNGEKATYCATSSLSSWALDMYSNPPNYGYYYHVYCSDGSVLNINTIIFSPEVRYQMIGPEVINFRSFPKIATDSTICLFLTGTTGSFYIIDVDPSGNINDRGAQTTCT